MQNLLGVLPVYSDRLAFGIDVPSDAYAGCQIVGDLPLTGPLSMFSFYRRACTQSNGGD